MPIIAASTVAIPTTQSPCMQAPVSNDHIARVSTCETIGKSITGNARWRRGLTQAGPGSVKPTARAGYKGCLSKTERTGPTPGPFCRLSALSGTINAPRRFFLAADMGDFLEHVINRAHIDDIGCCDLMLTLS